MNAPQSNLTLICVTFALIGQLTLEADRDRTPERILDQQLTAALADQATVILVGLPIDYAMQDRYGLALHEDIPFTVTATKVLLGDTALKGEDVNIRVTRDEVKFRYDKQQLYIFFLKRATVEPPKNGRPFDPGWRVVSDFFGVQPYTKTLEQWVKTIVPPAANP